MNYDVIKGDKVDIFAWNKGVPFESEVYDQARNLAKMDFMYKHVALMPDAHVGIGSTVGSVIATKGAIIPAATGVDGGCGVLAIKLSIKAHELPDNLNKIRLDIEEIIPVGFNEHTNRRDLTNLSPLNRGYLGDIEHGLELILEKHPDIEKKSKDIFSKAYYQCGSLGGGNHFIELCLDEEQNVWIMLHSGSRGIGNMVGSYFIELAKKDMEVHLQNLPNKDLAYLREGTQYFDDYVDAMWWIQNYARMNRLIMLDLVLHKLRSHFPKFQIVEEAISCHHNYLSKEEHFGEIVYITRKGAVNASSGKLGIIPGSMGAKSFIVRGKGNADSFCSCSHGAGRRFSRSKAKQHFTLEDHKEATKGVECRKDIGVLDETPGAYKNIDSVIKAQDDLVEVVHTLKQFLCIKG